MSQKQEEIIQRLETTLLDTGMMNRLFIDWIKEDKVDRTFVQDSFSNFRKAVIPDLNKVAIEYVLGFMFDTDAKRVLLIWKNRPSWQAGKLNGIGGKIEQGETPLEAMEREFTEETGFRHLYQGNGNVLAPTWKYVGQRVRPANFDYQEHSYRMHIFMSYYFPKACDIHNYYYSDYKYLAMYDPTMIPGIMESGEEIIVFPLNYEILRKRGVYGLAGLIDMVLSAVKEGFTFRIEEPMEGGLIP